MDGNLFCGGSTFTGLPCFLILTAYALCLAARIGERGGFRDFQTHLRGIWASWPPALRAVMTVLLVCCAVWAQKPENGGGTNNAAVPAQQTEGDQGQSVPTEEQATDTRFPGGTLNNVGDGEEAMYVLEGGSVTNGWWSQEGRDGTDSDGDGMPDAWERAFGLAPADLSDAEEDPDRDTVSNLDEFLNRTHPRRRDTDGDGMPDAYEIGFQPDLCPWLPDDTGDTDGDGLANFHEMALGADPLDSDTNGDGRTDGEEAGEGVAPSLDPPDWAAYGTGEIAVRVDGVQAARRAGIAVGHVLHSGVPERTYAFAAGESYGVSVTDLDPDNTNACTGTVTLWFDGATVVSGFTNSPGSSVPPSVQYASSGGTATFTVGFPLPPPGGGGGSGGGSGGTGGGGIPVGEVTPVGIYLSSPDCLGCPVQNGETFVASARTVPEGSLAGSPYWSFSGGTVSPASGSLSTLVTVDASLLACPDCGALSAGITCQIGERTVTRSLGACQSEEGGGGDPGWDGRRYIAHAEDDPEPVELTYALAFSTNPVPFVWHGAESDEVNWTVKSGPARFLDGGVEKTAVSGARSVMVLPKDETLNSLIEAKYTPAEGRGDKRLTEFRTVTVVAEPVCVFYPGWGGALVNPSGFRVGDEATFRFLFSANVDDDDLQWIIYGSGEAAEWVVGGDESGKGDKVVRGKSSGTGSLSAIIGPNYDMPSPKLDFKNFDLSAPIPIHVGILCDTNGNTSATLGSVDTKINLASNIFRQVGIGFYRASVTWITNHGFYASDPQITPGYLYTNDLIRAQIQQNDGMEIYFCPWDMVQATGAQGVWTEGGILIAKDTADVVVAHELGHAFGWEDVYSSGVFGTVSQTRLPHDWNNGPGPEEYYPHGMTQANVVDRLLMSSGGGMDIPSGKVFGRPEESSSPRLTNVGERDMITRFPFSQ